MYLTYVNTADSLSLRLLASSVQEKNVKFKHPFEDNQVRSDKVGIQYHNFVCRTIKKAGNRIYFFKIWLNGLLICEEMWSWYKLLVSVNNPITSLAWIGYFVPFGA